MTLWKIFFLKACPSGGASLSVMTVLQLYLALAKIWTYLLPARP